MHYAFILIRVYSGFYSLVKDMATLRALNSSEPQSLSNDEGFHFSRGDASLALQLLNISVLVLLKRNRNLGVAKPMRGVGGHECKIGKLGKDNLATLQGRRHPQYCCARKNSFKPEDAQN